VCRIFLYHFIFRLRKVFTSSNTGVLELIVPAFQVNITAQYFWNYTSEPMPGLNGRTLPVPRGHVLGGSSSVSTSI
jgi:choline dehydrogenase